MDTGSGEDFVYIEEEGAPAPPASIMGWPDQIPDMGPDVNDLPPEPPIRRYIPLWAYWENDN